MAIGHLIICQHLAKWQGEVLFYTCGRAQQTLIFSQRLHVPEEKIFTVSNPLHQLLSKSPGLCMRFWLVGSFSVLQHPCSEQ